MLLVLGATGELGIGVVRQARAQGAAVRALVRPGTAADDLTELGVEIVRGDLADPPYLAGVCEGVDVVVATASAIVPRKGERSTSTGLTAGYRRIGTEAEAASVRRLVFVSVPTTLFGVGAAEFDEKAKIEQDFENRSFELCVVRSSLFMETWLPAVGSRLAVGGGRRATLDRGFWLTRLSGAVLHQSIDRFGVAQVPGRAGVRHSFVCIDDVASAVTRLALSDSPVAAEVMIGGPAALSWDEVASAHAAALGRRIRSIRVPSAPFRLLSRIMRRVSPAASHLLAAQSLVGRQSTEIASSETEQLLGRPPTSVSEHLARRAQG